MRPAPPLAAIAAAALAACGEARNPTVGGPCGPACPGGSICVQELAPCPTSTPDVRVGVATAGTCELEHPPCLDRPEPCGPTGVCVDGRCERRVEPCANRPPKCPAGCEFDAVQLCACVCASCP
jgi:hypothetical protein